MPAIYTYDAQKVSSGYILLIDINGDEYKIEANRIKGEGGFFIYKSYSEKGITRLTIQPQVTNQILIK